MLSKEFWDRLRRDTRQGWIAGVCAGLANHFDWNVKLVRVLFVLGLLFSGFFPVGLIYAVLWYLMDENDGRDIPSSRDAPLAPDAPAAGDPRARFERLEQRLRKMEECVASRDFELRRELRKLES